jgi:modulator of FtsH protease HflK
MDRKERTVLVTLLVSALLIGFKFWLASASGSLSLRASATHSVADAAILGFVLLGLGIARWDASRRGLGAGVSRIENWVALSVAGAIFYVGFDIVREVLLGEPPDLRNVGPVALAALVTIPVAFVLARYLRYVGEQTDSPALRASGYHAQMDIYASAVAVAGLLGAALGLPSLDRAAAAVVVVFVLFAGYEIVSSAIQAIRAQTTIATTEGHARGHAHTGRGRLVVPVAVLLLLALYLLSGLYIVQPGEVAVVRRFGGVVGGNVGPGLHYRLPWPIDRETIVAVDTLRRTETPTSLMLTGDESLIAVRASVNYSVSDPVAFILNVADAEDLARQAGESALRQIVAQEGVDALLTLDKAAIQQRAAALAQAMLDRYGAGVAVRGVQLLESSPPPEVADAFRDVASAREDRNTFINEALAYQNEVVPVARGQAETTIQAANAYSSEKLARATGEAAEFASRQGAYAQAPVVTRTRLYLEAVEKVLPGARTFILDRAVEMQTTDLWIPGTSGAQPFTPQP